MTSNCQPSLHARPDPDTFEQRRELAAEVEELLRQAAAADGREREDLLQRSIVLSTPIARTLAKRYHRRGVEAEDLDQVAYEGLLKAITGYRPGPGTDFRSYAIPTIRGELRRYFRDRAWMVRPPRRIQNLQTDINAVEGDLAVALGRWPTEEEVAEALGVSVDEITEAQQAKGCFHPASLDAPITASPDLTLGSLVSDPADTYELVDQVESLRPVVAGMAERDRLIFHRRFVEHRTQAEIGNELGVSQMQVSRLLSGIMTQLRSALTA